MTNPIIETDLAKILEEIKTDQKNLLKEVTDIKLGQAKFEAKIDTVEEKLSGEIKNVKTDLTWIKWLFGILGSTIVLLLGIILTVTFKLLGN